MTPEEAGALAADDAIDGLPALPSDLSAKDARELTIRTVQIAATLWESLRLLYLGRAWLALGYASWDDYCTEELRGRIALPREDRPAIVQSLRDAGLSTRAIASAVGVSKNTVTEDLREVSQSGTPVIGRDGKSYAPPRPKPTVDPDAVAADLADRDPEYADRADSVQAEQKESPDPRPQWRPPPPDPVAAREAESLAARCRDFTRLCEGIRRLRSAGGAYYMADYDPQAHIQTDRERETFTTPFLVDTAAVLAELIEWSKA